MPTRKNREQGSVVVEASIIFPIFLLALLFFVQLFYVLHIQITLNNAVKDTTRIIATHLYPVTHLQPEQAVEANEDITYVAQAASFIQGLVSQQALKHYLSEHYPQLKQEYLKIKEVSLPLAEKNKKHVKISVEYRVPLLMPGYNKQIVLSSQAIETGWLGVTERVEIRIPDDSRDNDEDDLEDDELLELLYISSPVQRGRYLFVEAQGRENGLATVTLYYQSGFVKSVPCQANASGRYFCSIIIGGNSREGEYQLLMETSGAEATGSFIVLSKENYQRR